MLAQYGAADESDDLGRDFDAAELYHFNAKLGVQRVCNLCFSCDTCLNKDVPDPLLRLLLDRQRGFQLIIGNNPLRLQYVAKTHFSFWQVQNTHHLSKRLVINNIIVKFLHKYSLFIIFYIIL